MASYLPLVKLSNGRTATLQSTDVLLVRQGAGKGIDVDAAGVLEIGIATATSIDIAQPGVLVTIKGDLQVDGAETVIGTTTFEGDVDLGDNTGDTINLGGGTSDFVNLKTNLGFFSPGLTIADATNYVGALYMQTVAGGGGVDLRNTGNGTEGSLAIGVYTAPLTNITPASDDLQAVLEAINTAIGTGSAQGLDDVMTNSGTHVLDNDVTIPAAAPLIYRDGGVSLVVQTAEITNAGSYAYKANNGSSDIFRIGKADAYIGIGSLNRPDSGSANYKLHMDAEVVLQQTTPASTPSMIFSFQTVQQLVVQTPNTNGATGGNFGLVGGKGGPADGAGTPGGTGGNAQLVGGTGGNGSGSDAPGNGANVFIRAGQGGSGGTGVANGGDLYIDAGAKTGAGTHGVLYVGTSTVLTNVGRTSAVFIASSGVLTTVNGNLDALQGVDVTGNLTLTSGVATLTANGASSLTTSAGALTLTSFASATWSVSSGNLTLDASGDIFAGTNVKPDANNSLALGASGAVWSNIYMATVGGVTTVGLKDTGSSQTTSGAAAIGVYGAGFANISTSIDDVQEALLALDSAIGSSSNDVAKTVNGTTAIAAGETVAIATDGGNTRAWQADHTSDTVKANCVGIARAAAATGATVSIIVSGETPNLPDAAWEGGTAPTAGADIGKTVYGSSTTPGRLTFAPFSTSGTVSQKIGTVSAIGSGTSRIIVQPADGILN